MMVMKVAADANALGKPTAAALHLNVLPVIVIFALMMTVATHANAHGKSTAASRHPDALLAIAIFAMMVRAAVTDAVCAAARRLNAYRPTSSSL